MLNIKDTSIIIIIIMQHLLYLFKQYSTLVHCTIL